MLFVRSITFGISSCSLFTSEGNRTDQFAYVPEVLQNTRKKIKAYCVIVFPSALELFSLYFFLFSFLWNNTTSGTNSINGMLEIRMGYCYIAISNNTILLRKQLLFYCAFQWSGRLNKWMLNVNIVQYCMLFYFIVQMLLFHFGV